MADFLGSYYTNFLEDDGVSARMALLKAEQPVSILAMEKLLASKRSLPSDTKTNSSSTRRFSAIDNLHIRDGMDIPGVSKACSLDGPDFEIPVASMSLFEQDSLMVSVQLKSLNGVSGSRDRQRRDVLLRSRSSMERGTRVETFVPRARTTDFDIDPPTSETDVSSSTATPRTRDSVFSTGKRSTLKSCLLKFMGRKKYNNTSKRK